MKRFRFWPVSLLGLIGLMVVSLFPKVTLAHPLDQFLLASYLTVAPQQVIVEIDMTPGVLLAPQFLQTLDTNGDQQISEAEGRTYAELVLKSVELKVDQTTRTVSFTKIDMPEYLTIQAGYGTMRLYARADLPAGMTGTHQVYYKNNYQPTNPAYQINAFIDDTIPVKNGPQNRDSIQQSMTMDYTITGAPAAGSTVSASPAAVSSAVATPAAAGNSDQLQQMFNFLYQPDWSPWLLVAALGLSVLLGGLHALTPGHGKTMVAAYLVGSRGTARHAIALGGIVTFTHTISVIGIGLVALLASQFIVPALLVPILESIAGLLVLSLGARLLLSRWRYLKGQGNTASNHSHDHEHPHSHDHDHEHDHIHEHSHSHDAHTHTHALPDSIKPGDLLAMGISGGLVPCPEALGILVMAIGLNKIGLGLGLIVAFSLGVASVLITIGLLLVRARTLLDRLSNGGKGWQRWLPLVSAGIVTVIGIAMVFNGLRNYSLMLSLALVIGIMATVGIFALVRWVKSGRLQPVLSSSSPTNERNAS